MSENDNTIENLEFDVTMTSAVMYDFQIYNTYNKTSAGIVGTGVGTSAIIMGLAYNYVLFVIMGIVLVLYTPISLKLRSAQQMKNVEAFSKPLHYSIGEEGITVSQGETTQTVTWDNALSAVSTKQSIIVYTGKTNASIFPRKQLGTKLPFLIATLARYMEPKRVKIRF